jgi:hypothetical protein
MPSGGGSGGKACCCSDSIGGGAANRLHETCKSPPHRVTTMWFKMWVCVVPVSFSGAHTAGRGCFLSGVLDRAPFPLVGPIWRHVSPVGGPTQFGGGEGGGSLHRNNVD